MAQGRPPRGSVIRVDVRDTARGSEAGATHTLVAVVVQATALRYGTTVLVVPFTTNLSRAGDPFGIRVSATRGNGLRTDSVAMCWQVMAVDLSRLAEASVGRLSDSVMDLIAKSVAILVDYEPWYLARRGPATPPAPPPGPK